MCSVAVMAAARAEKEGVCYAGPRLVRMVPKSTVNREVKILHSQNFANPEMAEALGKKPVTEVAVRTDR